MKHEIIDMMSNGPTLRPLQQWICDRCGQVIEKPSDGYLLWKSDMDLGDRDFRIIHHVECHMEGYGCSMPLKSYVGSEGLSAILSMLSLGPIMLSNGQSSTRKVSDLDEFVDLVRRLHVPYYEEARQFFGDPEVLEELADSHEYAPYTTRTLLRVIDTYGDG